MSTRKDTRKVTRTDSTKRGDSSKKSTKIVSRDIAVVDTQPQADSKSRSKKSLEELQDGFIQDLGPSVRELAKALEDLTDAVESRNLHEMMKSVYAIRNFNEKVLRSCAHVELSLWEFQQNVPKADIPDNPDPERK